MPGWIETLVLNYRFDDARFVSGGYVPVYIDGEGRPFWVNHHGQSVLLPPASPEQRRIHDPQGNPIDLIVDVYRTWVDADYVPLDPQPERPFPD